MQNKIFPLTFISTFVILFLFHAANADQIPLSGKIKYVPEIEKAYEQGLRSYKSKNYDKSVLIFEKLAEFNPVHQRISISQLMYAKSLMKLSRFHEAINQFRNLLAQYPQTRYAENCHYELGSCFYFLNNHLAATREFLWLIDYGRSPELMAKAKQIAEYQMANILTLSDLKVLAAELPGPKAIGLLTRQLAGKQAETGLMNAAINTVVNFLNDYPQSEYAPGLETFLNKIRLKVKADLKIGIILPVTSGYSDDGLGILRGISYALKEFQRDGNPKIELIVRNSGSNVVNAVKAAQSMMQDDNIIALIGELESDITAAIGSILNSSDLPLIAPVASQNGLASINGNIFQANSDLFQRGRQIASYAIEDLGMKTFAAIAPADEYGQEMIEGFTTTIEELGGSIVAPPKWYFQGSTNLNRQLRSIRTLGFNIMKEDSAWARRNAMLLAEAVRDTFIVPITSIDGLFCPVYTDEIKYLGPQCANINLRTHFLGGDYWFDPETLRASQSYIDSVVFVSDYYVNEYLPEYRRFRTDFRIKMGHDPGRMEAFGYDAMKAILQTIKNNDITNRQKLKEKLQTIKNFNGIKGTISWLGNQRVNTDVSILQYKNGTIRKVR